ncbi:M50 family metallopeptidase [Nesterenkonia muleiensis]|uniref:M50 family metallopeptidase n=1 Tax=Nesterenkonia muleiensis TaxID=2282648 RepID=UPI001300AD00|nr:M50 family metallopeptidase [Nesterenkonia muleiensis]
MTERLRAAWEAVIARWGVEASPDPAMVAATAGLVLVLTAVPAVWRISRQASTIIHEMGHVLAAWLSGRRVSGIKLHTDTSGVTVSRGKTSGPGLLITFLAGYPAPGLLAVGLVWLATAGHSGAALTVYVAVLLLALLLSRNVVGVLSCLMAALASGFIWWRNDPEVVGYTVVALGVFYALAGVRGTLDVCRVHLSRGGGRSRAAVAATDASQAARAWRGLPLPAALWLIFFLLISLGCAAAVFWMLFR